MEDLKKLFKALSDETRLRILNVVVQRECCVCEVMQALDISQSRASRNLRILEDAGFLKSHREGAWVHYALNDDTSSNFVSALAKMSEEILSENPLFIKDRERLQSAVRLGDECK